ncbi:MAG TPA: amidohydrolase family protein, partial [Gemmatimonadales bacterium]|nr:amidohydrolase family protein [Gemmatimonadales bacterium]
MRAHQRTEGPLDRRTGALALAVALTLSTAAPLKAQTIAITGGTVYPVSGPKIEGGTVIIQDGKITAVGTNLQAPAGAKIIDARGKWVTPGLIHAGTALGLTQVGSVDATNEGSHAGDINAAFNVAEGIDPSNVLIPIARIEGVTTAVTGPSGGLVSGQAVIMDLSGDRIETLVTKSPAAMVINLNENSKSAGGGSRAGQLERLRQLFADAQEYDRRRTDFQKNQMQALSAPAAELEALRPVLKGELPVVFVANRRSDILSVLRLGNEYKLKMIIEGGVEAWQVGSELAKAGVPVAVNTITNIPSFDGLGARFDNAALLRAAGVSVIVEEGETGGPRNLRWAAGHAVRFGMNWDDALAAITLAPAKAFGIDGKYGTLQTGKVANLVVWSGD